MGPNIQHYPADLRIAYNRNASHATHLQMHQTYSGFAGICQNMPKIKRFQEISLGLTYKYTLSIYETLFKRRILRNGARIRVISNEESTFSSLIQTLRISGSGLLPLRHLSKINKFMIFVETHFFEERNRCEICSCA